MNGNIPAQKQTKIELKLFLNPGGRKRCEENRSNHFFAKIIEFFNRTDIYRWLKQKKNISKRISCDGFTADFCFYDFREGDLTSIVKNRHFDQRPASSPDEFGTDIHLAEGESGRFTVEGSAASVSYKNETRAKMSRVSYIDRKVNMGFLLRKSVSVFFFFFFLRMNDVIHTAFISVGDGTNDPRRTERHRWEGKTWI